MIVADVPDPRVLEAARRRDEHAFRGLVEPHRRELHAVVAFASPSLLPHSGSPAESA